jgi:hypothetical protein
MATLTIQAHKTMVFKLQFDQCIAFPPNKNFMDAASSTGMQRKTRRLERHYSKCQLLFHDSRAKLGNSQGAAFPDRDDGSGPWFPFN